MQQHRAHRRTAFSVNQLVEPPQEFFWLWVENQVVKFRAGMAFFLHLLQSFHFLTEEFKLCLEQVVDVGIST